MKKTITLLYLLVCCTLSSFAQLATSTSPVVKRAWKPTMVNIGFAADWNRFESMSLPNLLVFAEDPEQMQRDLSGMTEEANTTTAGLSIYGSVSFSPLNRRTGNYRNNQAFRLGIAIYSPKEAMVSYKNETLDTSIVYCNIQGEVALEGAYVFRGQWGKRKRWHWYIGGGVNMGFTFGNKMMLVSGKYFEPGAHPSTQEGGGHTEEYEAKSVYYSRLYIPYGIHYQIDEDWVIGFDFRKGLGWQFIEDDQTNFMQKSGALMFGMRYLLK